jgi:hypothetical protein
VEGFVKLRFYLTFVFISVLAFSAAVFAQADTLIGQFTNSTSDSFAGAISGNGRFVVFESRGNLATENPRNADGNVEIFLWDYAQRRIFQITNTKNLLFNPSNDNSLVNIRVEIINTRPVISNDGKWIAFSSNATIAFPGDTTHPPIVSTTNPGLFDANTFTSPTPVPSPSVSPSPTPGDNSLTNDGNLEIWLYQIPNYADVPDLSAGEEIPFVNLAPFNADGTPTTGAFVRVTNTFPSALPRPGTSTTNTFVANDNHDVSISDDGHAIAFASSRDLVPPGNSFPDDDNDEIFTFIQGSGVRQVTRTGRGTPANPIYNKFPTISGPGTRVAFASTGDNPIIGMTGGSNPSTSQNEEIFFSDLDAVGAPTGTKKQITTTTPTNPGDVVNILDPGRRMSRDGRYIAFDSFADLANENGGTNQTSFALYVYDTAAASSPFRRIGPRSNADSAATGGDIAHFPGFTDTDALGAPSTLVLETRLNIKADGTVAATESDGLNPDPTRPVQIYTFPLTAAPASATFKRLTKLPISQVFLASTQPFPSNTQERMAFNLALTETGTGNPDLATEVYYLLQPEVTTQSAGSLSFATGASRIPVSPSPVPTPTATATPTATPTPTPTASPTPTVTPTPQTPPAVQGMAPGMLAILNFTAAVDHPIVARTAVGSLSRSFTLPIELSGVTLSINGIACGLQSVTGHSIVFVVPPALSTVTAGTSYPIVLNNNGVVIKGTVVLVPARPDVFTLSGVGPGGRARMFNITNRVPQGEPFNTFTVMQRGGRRVPSHMRLYFTGAGTGAGATYSIRIGPTTVAPATILTPVLFEPGVYYIDFDLPSALQGAGDQPVIVTVTVGGVAFVSRLDDTAPRVLIL